MTSLRSRGALLALVLLAGCEAFRSDSENFIRQQRAERARRLAGMKAATAQTPAGERVSAGAVAKLVEGRTHVFVYQTAPGGLPGPYREYSFFAPGGHFIYMNTAWAKNPAGRDDDRWRADGDRLCILSHDFSSNEKCYRLAVQPDRRIQYFISAPGEETDGLLTKVTDAIEEGPPKVGSDAR
jgi:hypothetical protein